MALTGAALLETIGNVTNFQTLNKGTGAGVSDFYAGLKNDSNSPGISAPSPTLGQ